MDRRESRYGATMATLDDVRRIALALPETSEGTRWHMATWFVRKAGFVWERPLSKTDVRQLGELGREIPEGELLGVKIEGVELREAIIADDPAAFFTIPHFDNYAAVLLRLDQVDADELEEIIEEAWLVCAPKRVADAYLAEREG